MIKLIKYFWNMEIIRYLFAGGSAFVFDTLVFHLFNGVLLPDLGSFWIFGSVRNMLSVTAGFLIGLLINNLVSIFVVFTSDGQKEKGRTAKAFWMFSLVGVIGLALSIGGNQLCIYLFGEGKYIELLYKFLVAIPVMGWNYLGRKFFVSER